MSQTETSLKITRQFPTSVDKLFQAWSDPKQMSQWMGPGDVECKGVEIDFKVGGKYRIHMEGCEGSPNAGQHIAFGEYKEIIPNEKIQFTWSWENGEVTGSLVTIQFKATGDSSELTLIHEQFPSAETAQKHTQGWGGCLDNLTKFFS